MKVAGKGRDRQEKKTPELSDQRDGDEVEKVLNSSLVEKSQTSDGGITSRKIPVERKRVVSGGVE